MVDINKNLEEITGIDWGGLPYSSYLVITCHKLRKKALKEFSAEDFRIMIGQEVDLDILVPLSLGILLDNPLAEGDYYPGDLLSSILNVSQGYWENHQSDKDKLYKILKNLKSIPEELKESHDDFIIKNPI